MVRFKLTPGAHRQLRELAHRSPKAREVRRAQALLWLHEGQRVSDVAHQLGTSQRTVRRWMRRYRARLDMSVAERLGEGRHSGRRPKQLQRAQKEIERVWHRDPRRYGFRALLWTVPMLRCQIHQRRGEWVGLSTIRRALRGLGYRYKRPRLTLARRASTWRQAKGGLNAG
jgi:transposase